MLVIKFRRVETLVGNISNTNEEQRKKVWIKPELDVLKIKNTEYWEFLWNDQTGFWENVWVGES